MSIDKLFDGSSYSSSPERFPRKESVAEIVDIKGSTKSVTIFTKRKELVEKELLDTIEKNNWKGEHSASFRKT